MGDYISLALFALSGLGIFCYKAKDDVRAIGGGLQLQYCSTAIRIGIAANSTVPIRSGHDGDAIIIRVSDKAGQRAVDATGVN